MKAITLSCLALIALICSCKEDETQLFCLPTLQAGDTACHDYYVDIYLDLNSSYMDTVYDTSLFYVATAELVYNLDLNLDGQDDIAVRAKKSFDTAWTDYYSRIVWVEKKSEAFSFAVDSSFIARAYSFEEELTLPVQGFDTMATIQHLQTLPFYYGYGSFFGKDNYLLIREQLADGIALYWMHFPINAD